jgi:hypothetical protein
MRKLKVWLLASVSACAAIVFGQTLPSTFPVLKKGGIVGVDRSKFEVARKIFRLQGKEYSSSMTWQEVNAGPAWQPSSPLAISVEDAEEIARKELRKIASDEVRWQLTEFSINRFPGNGSPLWYLSVTMKPALALGEVNSDSFTLIMNSSGQPGGIEGFVGKLPQ